MIASIRGKLIVKDISFAVIECGGIGFKSYITKNTLASLGQIGEEVFLYTYLLVKEDALDLYGFFSESELEAFKLITSVNGVGAKIGLTMLSEFTAEQIMLFISSGDAKSLTSASGVGLKLAQRIILELKDKIGALAAEAGIDNISTVGNSSIQLSSKEAVEALVSLGYSQSEASLAVGRIDQTLATDELIKQALRILARGI